MPFLLLEKSALTYEELEVIAETHVPILFVYEETGKNRGEQPTYQKNVGFIYEQSALERYVRRYHTLPELYENGEHNHERPEELAPKIENAQREFQGDMIPTIGEWKQQVAKLIRQCYTPYTLWARKERAEEIKRYIEENGNEYGERKGQQVPIGGSNLYIPTISETT